MACTTNEKSETVKGLDPNSSVYAKNLEKAIYSEGNNFRTKKLIKKLEGGEKIYVAAIGGSVTEGAGPLNEDGTEKWTSGYAFQFADKLREKYPKAEIVFDGAGLSGTPSALGVIRYKKDVPEVLGENPDLLIVEFSVNDGDECTKTRGFERIIRNVLEAKKDAVVIPLYAHATYQNTQDSMMPVADFYKLPQISIRNALSMSECNVDLKQNGEFFADYVHPTEEGHAFMADCLIHLLEKIEDKVQDAEFEIPTEFYNKNAFETFNPVYSNTEDKNISVEKGSFSEVDTKTQSIKKGGNEFPDNWHHTKGTDPFRLNLNCKALVLSYKHQGNWEAEVFGKADVYVDGVKVKTLDGNSYDSTGKKTGWNDCVTEMIIDSSECKNHIVEIKMADGEENSGFTVLALGYSK